MGVFSNQSITSHNLYYVKLWKEVEGTLTGVNPDSIAMDKAKLGAEVLLLRADSANVAAQKELAQAVQAHYGQLDIAFSTLAYPFGHSSRNGRKKCSIARSTSTSKAPTS